MHDYRTPLLVHNLLVLGLILHLVLSHLLEPLLDILFLVFATVVSAYASTTKTTYECSAAFACAPETASHETRTETAA